MLGEFVHDISHLSGRKRLILLKEDSSDILNVELSKEVVILGENETVRLASVRSDRPVVSAEIELLDIADSLDIVTEFPQIIDRRLLDVFVCENSISHQPRTSSGSVVRWSWPSIADRRWRSTVRISSGWSW